MHDESLVNGGVLSYNGNAEVQGQKRSCEDRENRQRMEKLPEF